MFDVSIFGATGFVGLRFIKYYEDFFKKNNLNVAIIARSKQKLESVFGSAKGFNPIVADFLDREKVFEVVKKSKLVLNFAGPFDLYAQHIVEACSEFGVHYLDITGEVNFVKRMMSLYSEKAQKNHAMIVSCVGFDSIPSDYAFYLSLQKMIDLGKTLQSVDSIYRLKGAFNGGTIQTSFDMADKMTALNMVDRHYLTSGKANYQQDYNKARYIPEIKSWVSPFFMEPINSKIVYRSIELLEHANIAGNFQYRESINLKKGKAFNLFFTKLQNLKNTFVRSKYLGSLVRRTLPAPGQGPTEEQIQNGKFYLQVVARDTENQSYIWEMSSEGDPGNKSTIKLIGASMKCILDNNQGSQWGFLTPSAAFGKGLLKYLKAEEVKIANYEGRKE